MLAASITASSTLIAVIVGYIFSQRGNRIAERRRDQLTRVNLQLAQLYGPLFALTQSNGISWRNFCDRWDTDHAFRDDRDDEIDEYRLSVWREWMTVVFQPTNRRISEVLLSKADLLVDGVMPDSALQFFAHVASYDVVMHRWKLESGTGVFADVNYPEEFTDYVEGCFLKLQARQQQLLFRTAGDKY